MPQPGDGHADEKVGIDSASNEIYKQLDETAAFDSSTGAGGLGTTWQIPGTRYDVMGEIASGGMGVVLRAIDTQLERPLAVKVLLRPDPENGWRTNRFLQEARITGQLQHPGIPPVHDIGRLADERPFFSMKLIEGQTLSELLRQRPKPQSDRPRFLQIFEQIAQTLAYVHAQGVVHRDLKPLNIMIGAFGEVQVMDWGLAGHPTSNGDSTSPALSPEFLASTRPTGGSTADGRGELDETPEWSQQQDSDRITFDGQVIGTVSYMAPEQARGQTDRLDERCDVFALGAILCEILTGQPPYMGTERGSVLALARNADLSNAWARLNACGADAALVALVKVCLAEKPEDRPATAAVVSDRMTEYLQSVEQRLQAAEVEAAASAARAAEERKRRRVLLALAVSILVLIVSASAAAVWYQTDRTRLAQEELERQSRQDLRVAQVEREVENSLEEAQSLRDQAQLLADQPIRWHATLTAANSAIKHAATLAAKEQTNLAPSLFDRIEATEAALQSDDNDRMFVAEYESARIEQSHVDVRRNIFRQDLIYPRMKTAFQEYYSIELGVTPPKQAVQVLAARPEGVRAILLATLDECLTYASDEEAAEKEWLTNVLNTADNDPWRSKVRSAAEAKDWPALEVLLSEDELNRQPPGFLLLLSWRFPRSYEQVRLRLLHEVRENHPADFWANTRYAMGLASADPPQHAEAIRFYTVAAALRPDNPGVQQNLGKILADAGNQKEAAKSFRKALSADANYVQARTHLGLALHSLGKKESALAELRRAVQDDPKLAIARHHLGLALFESGNVQGAIAAFEKGIDLSPRDATLVSALGVVLAEADQLDEAIAKHRKAIELSPNYAVAYINLAAALMAAGQTDEAVKQAQRGVELGSYSADSHYFLGNALRMAGDEAAAMENYRRTIAIAPDHAEAHCNLGGMLINVGQFDEGLKEYQIGHELGSKLVHWPYPTENWVKDAERLVELDKILSEFLIGKRSALSSREKLELAEMCIWYKKYYALSARFFRESFKEHPKRFGDRPGMWRFNAAQAAALAATQAPADIDADDRASAKTFRGESLDWLQQELDLWKTLLEKQPQLRAAVTQGMTRMKNESKLASVRDREALAALPEDERSAFTEFWQQVDELHQQAHQPAIKSDDSQ